MPAFIVISICQNMRWLAFVFCSRGAFQSRPCPGSGGSEGDDVCSNFPLLVACISLSFAHLKAGTRPGWLLSAPFVRIALGAGPPPRDSFNLCFLRQS